MAHTELKSRARIEGKGRVVIPASFRSALGLKVGDEIDLRIEDNEIRISTLQSRLLWTHRFTQPTSFGENSSSEFRFTSSGSAIDTEPHNRYLGRQFTP